MVTQIHVCVISSHLYLYVSSLETLLDLCSKRGDQVCSYTTIRQGRQRDVSLNRYSQSTGGLLYSFLCPRPGFPPSPTMSNAQGLDSGAHCAFKATLSDGLTSVDPEILRLKTNTYSKPLRPKMCLTHLLNSREKASSHCGHS